MFIPTRCLRLLGQPNEESLPRVGPGAAPINAETGGALDGHEQAHQEKDKRPTQARQNEPSTETPPDVNYFEELAELRRQLAESADRERRYQERERQLLERERPRQDQDRSDGQGRIRVIRKPPGEAGDGVRGFNLQTAMELDENEEKNDEYNGFLRTMRENCPRAGITFARTYSGQDPAALAKLFKLNRQAIPYLTRERFPDDWAQVEALKQYIRNKRREAARRRKLALKRQQASSGKAPCKRDPSPPNRRPAKRARVRYSDDTDDNGAGPSRKRPHRRGSGVHDDDEEDDEEQDKGDDNNNSDEDSD
ncbi:hypothetical protein ONZ45_g13791 [Pleurotus djamor]|nr:hypothetical protein ONZ45_g13791 [Pleurotus djamor]